MKKIFFLVFTALSFVSFSQTEWFPIGAKWYYTEPGSDIYSPIKYISFEVLKDTTIIDEEYKVISVLDSDNTKLFEEFFRENEGKVYYWNYYSKTEHLLYDFSAEEGDTIEVHSSNFKPTEGFFKDKNSYASSDSLSPISYVITGVKDSLINGKVLKVQNVQTIYNDDEPKIVFQGEIIELMGDKYYLFGSSNVMTLGGSLYQLFRCYYENGFNFKIPTWNYDCDAIPGDVSYLKITKDLISISPNPASSYFQLELETINNTIKILNLQGQVVYQEQTQNKNPMINIEQLSAGIYSVVIIDENGKTKTWKLIKE